MKTKLTLIVVAMLAVVCIAGNSPRNQQCRPKPRDLEQRVAELEQTVLSQQAQIEALIGQVSSHQQEIERFAPLAGVMSVQEMYGGAKYVSVSSGMWVDGWLQTDSWLAVIGSLTLMGTFYQN